jgi:hypothetical protein
VDLVAVDGVEVAGLLGGDDRVDDPRGLRVQRVDRRLGRTAHRGRDEDEPGDHVGRDERGVQRDRAAHRVADEPRRALQEAQQVVDVAERLRRGRRLAEAAAVVGEHVGAPGVQRGRDVAPRAAVRDARVQEHDGRAVCGETVVCEAGHGHP